jgi:hypothetical protein
MRIGDLRIIQSGNSSINGRAVVIVSIEDDIHPMRKVELLVGGELLTASLRWLERNSEPIY